MARELNPDSTLAMARKAAERLAEAKRSGRYRPSDVDVLLDAFVELDEHLSAGGDYPDDWNIDENDEPGEDDDDDDDAEEDEEP